MTAHHPGSYDWLTWDTLWPILVGAVAFVLVVMTAGWLMGRSERSLERAVTKAAQHKAKEGTKWHP